MKIVGYTPWDVAKDEPQRVVKPPEHYKGRFYPIRVYLDPKRAARYSKDKVAKPVYVGEGPQ